VVIEAKNGLDAFPPHQRERQAISQAKPLIGELLQPAERFMPIITAHVEPDDFVRGKVVARSFGGVAGPCLPHQQGYGFIQNVLAREESRLHVLQHVPASAAGAVILVAG